jgi:hypothetical protein
MLGWSDDRPERRFSTAGIRGDQPLNKETKQIKTGDQLRKNRSTERTERTPFGSVWVVKSVVQVGLFRLPWIEDPEPGG